NRRIQSDGQHDHIELFFLYPVFVRGISYRDVLGLRVFSNNRGIASDKSNSRKVLCPLKISLKVLAIRTNIIVEYGTLGLGVMIFGQDDLFLRVGTAYSRAIAVFALGNSSRTNALNPSYLMGMLFIGST